MKKFYKMVDAGTAPGGYAVRLDGKPLRTPLKKAVLLPTKALADAIAQEWVRQGDEINPHSMPLTQLANTMIDKSDGDDRAEMNEELVHYGSSDLVCYFADHPAELVRRHKQHWLPLISWMKEHHGIAFNHVAGIQYHDQPEASLKKLEEVIKGLNGVDFTIVQAAAATTGSVVIALALLAEKLKPEEAYQAACVDEIFQLETWGEDDLARKRLNNLHAEIRAVAQFRDLLRS